MLDTVLIDSLYIYSKSMGIAGASLGVKIFGAVFAFALVCAIVNRGVGR